MAKKKLGSKHLCQTCEVKFYDLGRSPITCPRCGWIPDGSTKPDRSEDRAFDDIDDGVLKLRSMYENAESVGEDELHEQNENNEDADVDGV